VVGRLDGVPLAVGLPLTVVVGDGAALVGDALCGGLLEDGTPADVGVLGAVVAGLVVRGVLVGCVLLGEGVGDGVPLVLPKRLVPWPVEPWTRSLSGRPAATSMNVTMPATTTNMPTTPIAALRQVGRQLSRQVGRHRRRQAGSRSGRVTWRGAAMFSAGNASWTRSCTRPSERL
jgi:hypothetical protein